MILMNDFVRLSQSLRSSEEEAVRRVISSGWYILGREVKAFEAQWAEALGLDTCIGVANGLDALEIGLRALEIGPGDEVITTPMTAFATVLAILRAGAVPVLADIDPATGLLDMASAERCLSPRTRAVMLVHLYGQARYLDRWASFCADHGIHFLEDCAQAHLASWQGKAAGGWGVFAGWSFYPTKNLGALGDAGALTTTSAPLAAMAASLRNYGQSERYYHPNLGMNSRLDEMQAAILLARLPHLEAWTRRRRTIAQAYRQGIREGAVSHLALPVEPENHVYHLYVILCDRRDDLATHLAERGVQNLIHYPVPIHMQEPCRSLAKDPSGLLAAESHARRCLSLPCHPSMTDGEVEQVIAAVNAFHGDR